MKSIFLTAGRGSRLNHLTKKNHKSLLIFKNKESILGKLVDQFLKQGIKKKDITFVTGYKSKKIHQYFGQKYKYFFYKHFIKTNNLHTLISAHKVISKSDTIISFSDIVIQNDGINKILNKKVNKITLLVDTSKVRNGTMKISIKDKKFIHNIGKIPRKKANGNFIGILKVPKNKINIFKEFLKNSINKKDNHYYTEILNDLIKIRKEKIQFIDIDKYKWIEIDNLADYKKMKDNVDSFAS